MTTSESGLILPPGIALPKHIQPIDTPDNEADDDTKAMLKLDNFPRTFDTLAEKSFNGSGCNQIVNILSNASTLEEPLWWAGLSIAKFCDDGATAIHKMSEDHPEYNYEDTEEKASRLPAPRTCRGTSPRLTVSSQSWPAWSSSRPTTLG